MGLLKTVLVIVLVYYLLKILGRWFAPKLFSYAARKTEAHFRERYGQFHEQAPQEEEQLGDIIIDKKPTKKTNTSKKVGEYIDFEEIE
ncbi:DUF4834 family protein [Flavobacteriaceae bacterium 3-367]|uniref:DUF4834 family protein n=1 Tax=Eudoraea algarum TaxID=3417568 RepID=UPI00329525A3